MKQIAIVLTSEELHLLKSILEKLLNGENVTPQKKNNKWIREGEYFVNTITGKKRKIKND